MKKKLSFITALALAVSMVPSMMVSASEWITLGKIEKFEGMTALDGNTVVTDDANHNKALEITNGTVIFEWQNTPFEPDGSVAKASFDMKLGETDGVVVYTSPGNGNEGLLSFKNGNITKNDFFGTWNEDIAFVPGVTYTPNAWMHVDIVYDPSDYTEAYYINGNLIGIGNFVNKPDAINPEDSSKNGTGVFSSVRFMHKAGAVRIDNLVVSEYTNTATMSASINKENKIAVKFSEQPKALTARDFTLTRTTSGNASEKVAFSLEKFTGTEAVIAPASTIAGTYTLALANNKTTLTGAVFTNATAEVKYADSEQINQSWNMEDAIPAGWIAVDDEDDTYRGKVAQTPFGKNEQRDITIPFEKTLTTGKYIYSADMKMEKGYYYMRVNNADGQWVNVSAIYGNRVYNANTSNAAPSDASALGNTVVPENTWFRLDNVIDLDNRTYDAYVDGSYVGTLDVDKLGRDESNLTFNGMSGLFWSNDSGSQVYVDNLRIKNYADTFNADFTMDGNKIIIDFDETLASTDYDDSAFTVKVQDDVFGTNAMTTNAGLSYLSNTRLVLTLLQAPETGKTISVTLPEMTSFLGHKLASKTLTYSIPAEPEVSTETDDMSTIKSNWIGQGGTAPTQAATSKVSLTDVRTHYTFSDVYNDGIITLEMDVNLSSDSANQYIAIEDPDGDALQLVVILGDQLCYQYNKTPGTNGSPQQTYWKTAQTGKGLDMNLKWEIDPKTHLFKAYANGAYVCEYYPYPMDMNDGYLSAVSGLFFDGTNGNRNWTVDNISITNTVQPANGKVTESETDDMSTTNKWRNEGQTVVAAENGKVTTSGVRNKYDFSKVYDKGVITIETNVKLSDNEESIALYDNKGNAFCLAEIQANQICYHVVPAAGENTGLYQLYYTTNCGKDVDMNLKWEIDTATGKVKAYVNGNFAKEFFPYAYDFKTPSKLNEVKAMWFDGIKGGRWTVDDVTISQTYENAAYGSVNYVDVAGNVSAVPETLTKYIRIALLDGIATGDFSGNIVLKKGDADVAYTGRYDEDNKEYVMTLENCLGTGTFSLSISNIKAATGLNYPTASTSFTTAAGGSSYIGNVNIWDSDDGVSITFDCANATSADETYAIIYAGYTGNELVTAGYRNVTVSANSGDVGKLETFEDAKIANADRIVAYVWSSIEGLTPVTTSVVK